MTNKTNGNRWCLSTGAKSWSSSLRYGNLIDWWPGSILTNSSPSSSSTSSSTELPSLYSISMLSLGILPFYSVISIKPESIFAHFYKNQVDRQKKTSSPVMDIYMTVVTMRCWNGNEEIPVINTTTVNNSWWSSNCEFSNDGLALEQRWRRRRWRRRRRRKSIVSTTVLNNRKQTRSWLWMRSDSFRWLRTSVPLLIERRTSSSSSSAPLHLIKRLNRQSTMASSIRPHQSHSECV